MKRSENEERKRKRKRIILDGSDIFAFFESIFNKRNTSMKTIPRYSFLLFYSFVSLYL